MHQMRVIRVRTLDVDFAAVTEIWLRPGKTNVVVTAREYPFFIRDKGDS